MFVLRAERFIAVLSRTTLVLFQAIEHIENDAIREMPLLSAITAARRMATSPGLGPLESLAPAVMVHKIAL